MKVNLNFEPETLEVCPSCNAEVEITPERGKCPSCNYHCGSEFADQWLSFCKENLKDEPEGVAITFCHEGESDDFYIDIKLDANLQIDRLVAWLRKIDTGSCDIEPADIPALLNAGPRAEWDASIDILAKSLREEGWDGKEYDVAPVDLHTVCLRAAGACG